MTRDLAGGTAMLPRERVLATVVRLLDATFVRVGNEEYARGDFTAKDFRTWHGTVLALELVRAACFADPAERPGTMEILKQVAHRLRNTVAVCRKAYIHPEVLALGKRIGKDDEALATLWSRLGESPSAMPRGLRAAEWRLLRFLEEYVRKEPS